MRYSMRWRNARPTFHRLKVDEEGRGKNPMAVTNKTDRLPALDFTKGTLVLFMVLYHWLNYFVSPEGAYYKYLRFLTPSFIFITGFLIAHVYLSKYGVADARVPKRLLTRGLKILGIFILLNLGVGLLVPGASIFKNLSASVLTSTYITGNFGSGRAAAFCVLVPISYLLMLSAGLLFACRFYKGAFQAATVFFVLGIVALGLNGLQSSNLELLTTGLLGACVGSLSIARINQALSHPIALILAYIGYAAAITVWNVSYPLQVIGVFLTIMLIYRLGMISGETGTWQQMVMLLGKYSLFAYIAQIAILQLMHRGLHLENQGTALLILSLVAGFGLTVITVELVGLARTRAVIINRVYTAVFS
jgi:peptidoglycan/LPS O-acetylase OafA/YrhL